MANTVREQIAVCEKVATFNTAKGEKEAYTLRLGEQTFEVWQSQYFKAREGEKFRPFVALAPTPYTSKDGKQRANMKPFVNWEKVPEKDVKDLKL